MLEASVLRDPENTLGYVNLAVAFATRAILLHEGGILYDGEVAAMLASEAFERVFGPQIVIRHDRAGHAFAAYSARDRA